MFPRPEIEIAFHFAGTQTDCPPLSNRMVTGNCKCDLSYIPLKEIGDVSL
jgi:hypothetical protein